MGLCRSKRPTLRLRTPSNQLPQPIIRLGEGSPTEEGIGLIGEPEVIYPRGGTEISVPGSVPRRYASEYFETARVRTISPNASAALSIVLGKTMEEGYRWRSLIRTES